MIKNILKQWKFSEQHCF